MEKDILWSVLFEKEERFADIINACGLNGTQLVNPEDLKSVDSKNLQHYEAGMKVKKGKKGSIKYRDAIRKDGGRSLHDIIDFSDIPDELKGIVQDYKVNLIEIRKWKDTSVFKTDIRQVFDFIRCSKEKEQVKRLVINNPDYEEISEDAYDVMKKYANLKELKEMKREDGNMVNMAKGLQDWAAEEREEGKIEGITTIVRNMLNHGMSDEDIMMLTESSRDLLEEVKLQNNI